MNIIFWLCLEYVAFGFQFDTIPIVVNLSGRFHLERGILAPRKAAEKDDLAQNGGWTISRQGKNFRVTQQSIDERLRTSMQIMRQVRRAKILTLHGDADEVNK